MLKKFSLVFGAVLAFILLLPSTMAFWGFDWDFPDFPDFDFDDFTFQSGEYTCPHTWTPTTSSDYFYDTSEIQIAGGKASTIDPVASYANAVVIATKYGTPYANLTSFSDSYTSDPMLFDTMTIGEIRYQLSPNAALWYYFDTTSNTWEESSSSSFSEANTSDVINANLASYNTTVGDGILFIRAFLQGGYFAGIPNFFGLPGYLVSPFNANVYLESITVNCSTFTFPDFEFSPPSSDFWGHFFDPIPTLTCDDGIKNQDETGIDCGGTTCPACSPTCTAAPTDLYWNCSNPPYTDSSTCLDNGRLNYLMTGCSDIVPKCCNAGSGDFDCYLISSKCLKSSGTPAVCVSGYTLTTTSFGNVCLESGAPTTTCVNAIKDGDETGVDCGGSCPACAVIGTCSDSIQNQNETAVDCGGVCSACPVLMATCSDGILNQDETAIDCGGVCSACPVVTVTCSDGIKNQDETDIDCGGICSACPVAGAFVDIPASNPHAEAIQYLKDHNIVDGYDTTHFGPILNLRRGELLKIALNGAGIDTSAYIDAESPYSDVVNHSLEQYIFYAYDNNIATGYGDGRFGPDNYTTFAEAAKMLLNINSIAPTTPPAGVTYNLPANSDLIGFVHKAMQMNLLYDPSHLVASENILRDYTAEIMYRILKVKDAGLSAYVES